MNIFLTCYHITIRRVWEKPEHVIRMMVDGVVVNGAGIEGTGKLQGMIPLAENRRDHFVEVTLR